MDFKTLFRFRKLYMGFAMLLLVLHHGRGFVPAGRFNELVALFYGGVDFFVFCSGVGCFFSYTSDRDPVAFLKRRAARIFPVYLAFMVYWIGSRLLRGGIALQDALGNLLCVQWLTGRTPVFNWYMSWLLVSYLLTPVLASLAERLKTPLRAVAAVLVLLLLSRCFWDCESWIILAARLPLFFTGMLFAAESRRRERLKTGELALLAAFLLAGVLLLRAAHADGSEALLWGHGMYWYPFLLIVPGACVLLAKGAELLERCIPGRWLLTAGNFVGSYTFEIFITHCYARGHGPLYYVVFAALYAAALHLASLAVKKAAELLVRLFRSRAKAV